MLQSPNELLELLAQLHTKVSGEPHRAAASILHAADELAEQWSRQHRHRQSCWTRYEEAVRLENHTHSLLAVVIDALVELVDASPPAAGRPIASRPTDASGEIPVTKPEGVRVEGTGLDLNRDLAIIPAPLSVFLFGPFRAYFSGKPFDAWQGIKAPRLARYLFAQHGRFAAREVLMELFWPEAEPEAARRALHQAVYQIRRTFRAAGESAQRLTYRNEAYAINTEEDWWSDVEEFERLIGASKRAEAKGIDVEEIAFRSAAEEYYTGDFLEDSPHEEWTLLERDRLRMIYLDSANRLGDLLFARDDYQGALEVTRRALTRDPCDEPAHRRAMRCYAALGQRTSVVRQYQTCAEAMSRAFELDPDRETTAVYETLTDGDRGRLANRS